MGKLKALLINIKEMKALLLLFTALDKHKSRVVVISNSAWLLWNKECK
jgi:hypothetical protein